MGDKNKVLIIENSVDVTGAFKAILRAAEDNKPCYNFCFVIPRNSKVRTLIEESGFVEIYELPLKELKKSFESIVLYIPFLLFNAFKVRTLIRRQSISLIHVNDIYNLVPAIIRLLGENKPYVCHVRFMSNRFPILLFKIWTKIHFHFASKVIAVSEILLKQLPPSDKLIMIHDPLPQESALKTLISDKTQPVFLCIANFIPGKGQNFAIEAFAMVHHKLPGWRLRFVGSDMGLKKNARYRQQLVNRSAQLSISDKIDWVGFTNTVDEEYKKAEIVLNFSESESLSLTCLEALFFGKPLIATDCGGPSEILEGGKIGILVPNKDIDSMATSMEKLANDPEGRKRLGAIAKIAVTQRFHKECTSMKLKQIYDDVIR